MAQLPERFSEAVCRAQGLAIVGAEPVAPLLVKLVSEIVTAANVAALQQVPGRAASKVMKAGVGGVGGVDGEQVGQHPCPRRPCSWVILITWIVGSKNGLGGCAGGGGLRRGEVIAQDGLAEPVHMQALAVNTG